MKINVKQTLQKTELKHERNQGNQGRVSEAHHCACFSQIRTRPIKASGSSQQHSQGSGEKDADPDGRRG